MPSFRTVSGPDAGPDAVGILVPPGRRTVIVLRPRALALDLLLVRRGDDGTPLASFHEAGRAEAELLATNLGKAVLGWAEGGNGCVEAVPSNDRASSWVRAEVGAFPLIACARQPGQAYRPAVFADAEAARQAAMALMAALRPAPDANRDFYFNTQHFAQ